MDAIDAMLFAVLAVIDLAFFCYLRWRRGHPARIERRVCRALRFAWIEPALQ